MSSDPRPSAPPQVVLLSLLSIEDERADLAALTMIRRFSERCTTVLVQDQTALPAENASRSGPSAQRRMRHLMTLAEQVGLTLDVVIREARQSLEDLKARSEHELLVLHQPRPALDRQTLTFRQLERAVLNLPNSVVYAPAGAAVTSQDIIAFTRAKKMADAGMASRFAGPGGRIEQLHLEDVKEVMQPESPLRLQIQSRSPAMIVIEAELSEQANIPYSRLAAVLGTPVLVITRPAS